MRSAVLLLFAFAFAFAFTSAAAGELDQRTEALAAQLRCVVCQSGTVADSNAPLAVQIKGEVRRQLEAGRSEREVADFLVQRYGDFVLYKPPFKPATWLLWGGPALLLAAGLALVARIVKRAASLPEPEESP